MARINPKFMSGWMQLLNLGLTFLILMTGCDKEPFEEAQVLGGQTISADVLNDGYRVYRQNCIACHGKSGDGDGASAQAMDPSPRDLTTGYFKFKSTAGDALPTDEDLKRTLKVGLAGTQMNAFDLPESELEAVVQYIKTLSPRWQSEEPGTPVSIPEDPWAGNRRKAIERGRQVYHGLAQCWTCHPAYEDRTEIEELVESFESAPEPEWRSRLPVSLEEDTHYGKLLPPDFSSATLRAARTGTDLFRTLAAGIGGTEMPSWSERLEPDDLWAVVYYVRELNRLGKLRRNRHQR